MYTQCIPITLTCLPFLSTPLLPINHSLTFMTIILFCDPLRIKGSICIFILTDDFIPHEIQNWHSSLILYKMWLFFFLTVYFAFTCLLQGAGSLKPVWRSGTACVIGALLPPCRLEGFSSGSQTMWKLQANAFSFQHLPLLSSLWSHSSRDVSLCAFCG